MVLPYYRYILCRCGVVVPSYNPLIHQRTMIQDIAIYTYVLYSEDNIYVGEGMCLKLSIY